MTSASDSSEFQAKPQVGLEHYGARYETARRWSSYWCQIEEALNFRGDRLLEVGIGNGVVADYLSRVAQKDLVTVDIDRNLTPDVVADIADMPFDDQSFDVSMACEVLEHMPLEHARKALIEMRRVSRNAVISVPDQSRYYFQGFVFYGPRPKRKRLFSIDLSRFFSRPPEFGTSVPFHEEHYWELNRGSVSVERFVEIIESAGWSVLDHYRNRECPYHHFFVLSSQTRHEDR